MFIRKISPEEFQRYSEDVDRQALESGEMHIPTDQGDWKIRFVDAIPPGMTGPAQGRDSDARDTESHQTGDLLQYEILQDGKPVGIGGVHPEHLGQLRGFLRQCLELEERAKRNR